MSSRERWGHTYIYRDGTVSNESMKGKELAIYFSVSENDGYRFMNRGPEAKMSININEDVNKSKLVKFIKKSSIDRGLKEGIEKLFKKGELTTGDHEI